MTKKYAPNEIFLAKLEINIGKIKENLINTGERLGRNVALTSGALMDLASLKIYENRSNKNK